jgi:hypothetical protein
MPLPMTAIFMSFIVLEGIRAIGRMADMHRDQQQTPDDSYPGQPVERIVRGSRS